MKGVLASLYRAKLVEGPSGPRPNVSGMLGVFDYSGGSERQGNMCLFAPDDPQDLGGKAKLRPGPGTARIDTDILRFTVKDDGRSYAWQLGDVIADEQEVQDYLAFAETNDRIIRHLLKGV